MAVKDSTLKQRIRNMKYHKLQRTSFRRSISFLLLMIFGITLPIACSDLRGSDGMNVFNLNTTSFEYRGFSLDINGNNVIKTEPDLGASATGRVAMFINAGEFGLLKVSPIQFDGGIKAGEIRGNSIHFNLNQMNGVLKSSVTILPDGGSAPVWIEHTTDFKTGISHGTMNTTMSIEEFLERNNAKIVTTSEPPAETETETATEQEDDFFVVVEQMPRLIGGMAALQSKVQYKELARRAGIEGRVTVQFIVNEQGDVEEPQVVRGIGGGLDEETLRVIKEAKFEPGLQRGRPVRVQYALSVNFRLEEAQSTSSSDTKSILNKL